MADEPSQSDQPAQDNPNPPEPKPEEQQPQPEPEKPKNDGVYNGSCFLWSYWRFDPHLSRCYQILYFHTRIVGVMSGIIADGDWRISLLAGYAGTDFLESLYRLRFAQFFKVS